MHIVVSKNNSYLEKLEASLTYNKNILNRFYLNTQLVLLALAYYTKIKETKHKELIVITSYTYTLLASFAVLSNKRNKLYIIINIKTHFYYSKKNSYKHLEVIS